MVILEWRARPWLGSDTLAVKVFADTEIGLLPSPLVVVVKEGNSHVSCILHVSEQKVPKGVGYVLLGTGGR